MARCLFIAYGHVKPGTMPQAANAWEAASMHRAFMTDAIQRGANLSMLADALRAEMRRHVGSAGLPGALMDGVLSPRSPADDNTAPEGSRRRL